MARPRSRYDELHDRYDPILTTKAGTRYERLAALVFKILEDKQIVIHDVYLRGDDPKVKHQIDVTIERDGKPARTIIECKDFDISGDDVGLDVIRNVRAVIEDTGADEGMVITCNGFTADARRYAKSKNIKLLTLRKAEEADTEGRMLSVTMNIIAISPRNVSVSLGIVKETESALREQLAEIGVGRAIGLRDEIYIVENGEKIRFNNFVPRNLRGAQEDPPNSGIMKTRIFSDGRQLQVRDHAALPFQFIDVQYELSSVQSSVTASVVAELVLTGFSDADLIIMDKHLERYTIDPETGVVSAQRR